MLAYFNANLAEEQPGVRRARVMSAFRRAVDTALAHDEPELIRKAKAGDRSALGQIVRAESPRVAALLTRILGKRGDLEDLVQEVFFEFCRALPRFRGESALSTYIGGIAVRVARRAMRPGPWWTRRSAFPEDVVAEAPNLDDRIQSREQLRRVRQTIAKLSTKKQVAFLLSTIDGMTVDEIAAFTGATSHTVKKRIYHARQELRRHAQRDPYLAAFLQKAAS